MWKKGGENYYRNVHTDCIIMHMYMYNVHIYVYTCIIRVYVHVYTCTYTVCVHIPIVIICIQVIEKLEREYKDCIKSRSDKIRITRHIMMHQVLYNVHVTLFVGQLHNI